MRTTAASSGDRGRDAELFVLDGHPTVGFQYSVTRDWRTKIRGTVRTVIANGLGASRLIYCTSQRIGADGDDLVSEIWRDDQIQLDIRDREWFCERELTTSARQIAAEELAARMVDPVLTPRTVATAVGAPLSTAEGRVALVHLAMNASDRASDSNLTKSSFDALVKAALVDTSADATLAPDEIVSAVCQLVPHGAPNQVRDLTMSALQRLSRRRGPVKLHTATGRYHLSFDAHEEWRATAAEYLLDQESLEQDLAAAIYGCLPELDEDYGQLRSEAKVLREALEAILLHRGEEFVAAVEGADPTHLSLGDLAAGLSSQQLSLRLTVESAAAAIAAVIGGPAERSHQHMRRLLDGYTLLAFLQETPDVQRAMSRVFERARIWIDTTAMLPLLAETLIDDPDLRSQTKLLRAAVESGVRLHVTNGVIEEIRFHIEKARHYASTTQVWRSRVPFIATAYLFSGRDPHEFRSWSEEFMGDVDPQQDIEEYLAHHFSVTREDLDAVADQAQPELRASVRELFQSIHTERRRTELDETLIDRLATNDMESAVGVIQIRRGSRSPLGHDAWWLTLDSKAFKLSRWLRDQLGSTAPPSPVLSPDYLSQLLRLGPARRHLGAHGAALPVAIDLSRFDRIPPDLVNVARSTRASMAGQDELRIRRGVRDALTRMQTSIRTNRDYASEVEAAALESMRQD